MITLTFNKRKKAFHLHVSVQYITFFKLPFRLANMFISFFRLGLGLHLTLKMASAQVVEMSVTNNSPSQDSNHPDDLFQSRVILSSPV